MPTIDDLNTVEQRKHKLATVSIAKVVNKIEVTKIDKQEALQHDPYGESFVID
ncbi:hypothetical protein JOD43_003872 [Pullulanibacillus pueri]|uniref:Uncharacterized protein n=1 Tax=Pullulanibacillus pueri TaxID=1437324 RepID=A0A8J3ENN5_9BACL|nr:hypothetical protein [Pullulanibacillus pueri]GGH87099.1 hypothetical protein GCM10007096_36330 [Pullulanibacillus pueri]